jgi:hypothetical protein
MLGLYHGEVGARQWKRTLSETAFRRGADLSVIDTALRAVAEARSSQARIAAEEAASLFRRSADSSSLAISGS